MRRLAAEIDPRTTAADIIALATSSGALTL